MTLDRDFESYMRRVLDKGHASRAGADAPPSNTWQRVLETAMPGEEEKNEMNTVTLAAPAATALQIPTLPRRGVGHYLNLAATIALVVAVAVAGWFATSQLNQPQDQFGLAPGTLELVGATCDIEPLSVDRVMEIVKNPVPFIENGPSGEESYVSVVLPMSAELYEYNHPFNFREANERPSREQFQNAEEVANAYLSCLLNGTQGQAWNFFNPVNIQQTILGDFPVFANEEDVRARVEERRELPAIEGEMEWPSRFLMEHVTGISTDPERDQARLFDTDSLNFESVIRIGVIMRDDDGQALVYTDGDGKNLIDSDPVITGTSETVAMVTLVKPRDSDVWLVIPYPSLAEAGNHHI